MIPLRLYLLGGGTAACLVLGYAGGSKLEHSRHMAREATASARIEVARNKLQTAFDALASRSANEAQVQTQTFTEIRRVAGPIIYRTTNVCLSGGDDGVGLLDRARDAANSATGAGVAASGAAPTPGLPPQR